MRARAGPRGDPVALIVLLFSHLHRKLGHPHPSGCHSPLTIPLSLRTQPEPYCHLFLIYLIQRLGCTETPTPAEEISIIISERYDWMRSHGEIKAKQSSRGERWKWKGSRWDCEPVWMKGSNNFASISFADPIALGLDYTVIPMPKRKAYRARPFLCALPERMPCV